MDIAHELSVKQEQASIAEFFEKNKHLLGFDNPVRALVTSVKEALDNSLDACEEASILPDIRIEISPSGKDEYRIVVEDNGPGIVEENISRVFGRLLFGSRFHAHRQSRGQQGIGISAVLLYSQITTGRRMNVISKTTEGEAFSINMSMDIKKNSANIHNRKKVKSEKKSGTSIEVYVKGSYTLGKYSILSYIRNSAVVNPHASITFVDPNGEVHTFERCSTVPPPVTTEIKPHPYGIEVGELLSMFQKSRNKTVSEVLTYELYGITNRILNKLCSVTEIPADTPCSKIKRKDAEKMTRELREIAIRLPSSNCLSPIGEELIKKGMNREFESKFTVTYTGKPGIYHGEPYIVEVGLLYGVKGSSDEVDILRFANRTPLMYQAGSGAIISAVKSVDWRSAGFDQRGGKGIPYGPGIILVHVASTNIPYTSESKDAIAAVPEITDDIIKGLIYCRNKLRTYVTKKSSVEKLKEKYEIAEIIPEMAAKSASLVSDIVPDSSLTVSRILNAIVVEKSIKTEENEKFIVITIKNVSPKKQKFRLYSESAGINFGADEKGIVNGAKIVWDVDIEPASVERYTYHNVPEGEGNINVYIKGLPVDMVIGADVI